MMNIRYSRIKRLGRKNRRLRIAAQVVATWYIAFFAVGYLSSNTGAYFSDQVEVTGTIQAGIWDDWTLDFTNKGNQNENEFSCPKDPFVISTIIKNIGTTAMANISTYELYYIENGNPQQNGTKVSQGEIPVLAANQEFQVTNQVASEGFYMFKAYSKSDQQTAIWSEKIKVNCKTGNGQIPNNPATTEITNTTTETVPTAPVEPEHQPAAPVEEQTTEASPTPEATNETSSSETTVQQPEAVVTPPVTEEGNQNNETSNN